MNSANSETWNWLILAILAILSGSFPWCVSGWCGVGDADLGIGPGAGLACELERDHPGDVPLERQDLEVEHQAGVVGVGGPGRPRGGRGPAGRCPWRRPRPSGSAARPRAPSPGTEPDLGRDPPGRADGLRWAISSVTESSRLDRFFSAARRSAGAPALAEEALEDDPRMGLGGQGGRRRRPGEVVLVDAGVAVVALADGREQVHRQSRATATASPGRSAGRRSGRRSCPGSSRCSRSAWAVAALRKAALEVACVPG